MSEGKDLGRTMSMEPRWIKARYPRQIKGELSSDVNSSRDSCGSGPQCLKTTYDTLPWVSNCLCYVIIEDVLWLVWGLTFDNGLCGIYRISCRSHFWCIEICIPSDENNKLLCIQMHSHIHKYSLLLLFSLDEWFSSSERLYYTQ